MFKKLAAASAAALMVSGCASTYSIQPVATAAQEVTYDHGTALTMSKKARGAVRVAPVATEFNGRMQLAVVAFNTGAAPANLGPENVRVYMSGGAPLQVHTYEQLAREARRSAAWATFAVALAGAANSYAASQPATAQTYGSAYSNRGYVNYSSTTTVYNPANAALANSINQANTNRELSQINAALGATLNGLGNSILRTTTIAPDSVFGGNVVVDRPHFAKGEAQTVRVVVTFSGEDHEFTFAVGGS